MALWRAEGGGHAARWQPPQGAARKGALAGGPPAAPDTLLPHLSRPGSWLCEQRVAIQTPTAPRKGYLQSGPFKCVQLGTERPRPRAMTGHPLLNVRPGGGMDKGWMLLLVIWWWGWGCAAWKRPSLSCPSILCPSGEDLGHSPSKLRPPSSVSEPQQQGVPVVHPSLQDSPTSEPSCQVSRGGVQTLWKCPLPEAWAQLSAQRDTVGGRATCNVKKMILQ